MGDLRMDFKKLSEKIGLEEDEYFELLELFLEISTSDIIRLENAVGTENADEAEKVAHSLKGASSSLGLTEIAEIAGLIENSAREKSIHDGTTLVANIKEKIKYIEQFISSG
jgi:histidine phosphotransfer protein HptB